MTTKNNCAEMWGIASLEGVKGSKRELEKLRDNSTNFVETRFITSHHYVVMVL